MLLYMGTILFGMLTIFLSANFLNSDMEKRKRHNQKIIHTALAVYDRADTSGSPIRCDLYCTYNILGRRKQKCDLSLDFIGDKTISKIHAIVWYKEGHFHIKPYRHGLLPRWYTYPEVRVNNRLVPPEGCTIYNGDLIRLGRSEFYLMDTKKEY